MSAAQKGLFKTLRATADSTLGTTYEPTAVILNPLKGSRLLHVVARMVSHASSGSGNQITIIPEIFITRDSDLSAGSVGQTAPNPEASKGGVWIPCPNSVGSTSLASAGTLYAGAAYTAVASGFGVATSDEGFGIKSLTATGNSQTIFTQFYVNPGAAGAFRCAVVFSGSGTAPAVEICVASVH